MTPEDWKKADEYVSAMAKNMSKAQGKPDSEAKPEPQPKQNECKACGYPIASWNTVCGECACEEDDL